MMVDRLMVQLYSEPAKATAPSQGMAYPSISTPATLVSRLSTPSSRPASAAPADQGEGEGAAEQNSDDETPLMSKAAFEAWEERFTSRFEDLIEAKRQGIALPPEAYELVEELKAHMALLTPPP